MIKIDMNSPFPNEYIGEFKDDKFHGKGKIINEEGIEYDGEWFQGKKNRYGTLKIPREGQNLFSKTIMLQIYVGEFKMDKIHGKGTMTYEDGSEYSGEWV